MSIRCCIHTTKPPKFPNKPQRAPPAHTRTDTTAITSKIAEGPTKRRAQATRRYKRALAPSSEPWPWPQSIRWTRAGGQRGGELTERGRERLWQQWRVPGGAVQFNHADGMLQLYRSNPGPYRHLTAPNYPCAFARRTTSHRLYAAYERRAALMELNERFRGRSRCTKDHHPWYAFIRH